MSSGRVYRATPGQITQGEAIGIIMMETFIPFPPGSPGNATTFAFPVRYATVRGGTMDKVVFNPDKGMLPAFLEAGEELRRAGCRAITGNCGFMILYQDEMAKAFDVPVFMSGMMQLPLISRMLRPGEKVGIITANGATLSPEHIRIATQGVDSPHVIVGLETQPHFNRTVIAEEGTLDFDAIQAEVVETARALVARDPAVKAFLFECTDLPPYAAAVQEAVGLPVFDYTTMIGHVFSGLVRRRFEGYV